MHFFPSLIDNVCTRIGQITCGNQIRLLLNNNSNIFKDDRFFISN